MRTSMTMVAVICSVGLLLAMSSLVSAGSWSFFSITDRQPNHAAGIAVDSNGVTHVVYSIPSAYTNKGLAGLFYANNERGSFKSVCIDKTVKAGTFVDLAIDSRGKLHIAYMDESTMDLLYITNAAGKWQRTVVDSAGNTGLFPHIAVDRMDNVHICYISTVDFSIDNTLKYAVESGGVWTISSLGWSAYSPPTVAVDSAGNAHVCYVGVINEYPLNYITNAGGSWSAPVAVAHSAVSPSIALGPSGKIYAAYVSFTPGPNQFVTMNLASSSDGLAWSTEIVDGSGIVQSSPEPSLAVDANENVHMAYSDLRSSIDYHVMYADNLGGAWNIQTVVHGFSLSMSLDKMSNPHIAYLNERAPQSLMCAIWG